MDINQLKQEDLTAKIKKAVSKVYSVPETLVAVVKMDEQGGSLKYKACIASRSGLAMEVMVFADSDNNKVGAEIKVVKLGDREVFKFLDGVSLRPADKVTLPTSLTNLGFIVVKDIDGF